MLRKLGIEPGEGRLFAWAAGVLFLVGWAEVSVKNASETLFLKEVGVQYLPSAFLVNSLLLVGTTYLVGRIADRSDRLKLLSRVLALLGIALVPLWFLVSQEFSSGLVLAVIASKQLQSIGLLVFFLALGDLLHGRQAKRLFAPLMAGMTLGTILGSFASDPLSRVVGIAGLFPISGAALVLAGVMARPLRRFRTTRIGGAVDAASDLSLSGNGGEPEGHLVAKLRELWSESRLFRLLFVMTVCSGLLGPMLYFQFSYVADLATQGEDGAERLMDFYANFRGWISVGVLATQLGLASTIYRRIGIPLSAAISPLIYLFGFLGLSVRLSLPVGVAAMAGTKLQDNAVYDPAIRVLFNLLPEGIRSRSLALLEGPVKRAGGAIGNIATMLAVQVGTAVWVGFVALPVSALWLVVALVLWRAYPALLMQASSGRARFGKDFELAEMLDPNTLRGLSGHLLDPDPASCRIAIELVSEANPELASEIFAKAASNASPATRPLLIAALDRVLERAVIANLDSSSAAAGLAEILDRGIELSDRDRSDVVQAYGRVSHGRKSRAGEGDRILARALGDRSAAVRLAAAAAMHRRGSGPQGVPDLSRALHDAIRDADPDLRRTAREEYRAELLRGQPSDAWRRLLTEFVTSPTPLADRAETAVAFADIAEYHGEAASGASDLVLTWKDDEDPVVREAVVRFVGHVGLEEHAGWLVKQVVCDGGEELDGVRAAAVQAVRTFGLLATDALLVELSFGKRSAREAILPLVRELELVGDTLQRLYESELNSIRHKLVELHACARAEFSPIILQRLGERLDEGVHTALQLLGSVHDDDRIYALADPLRRARGTRQYAILVEALEALLSPGERETLLPLMEDRSVADRGRVAARALGIEVPSGEHMAEVLVKSPDDLTRMFANAILGESMPLASDADVDDDDRVLSPVECALILRGVPLFEGLTARQLVNVAELVEQENYPSETLISQEGEYSDCMYIIVKGTVAVSTGDTVLTQLGPKDFFGEVAIFEGARRTADVISESQKVELLRISRDDLLRVMEELPAIAICICQTLSRRVRVLTERVNP
jgi:hypothetical protein